MSNEINSGSNTSPQAILQYVNRVTGRSIGKITEQDGFIPNAYGARVETIDLFVTGHDDEGPLYSGTIFLNGKPYDIRTESDKAELTADIPEGIRSLQYYVTDLAGNRSEVIGK